MDTSEGLSPRQGLFRHVRGTVPGRVPFGGLDGLELAPERRFVEVVDEGAGAVDLHDRQPLAIRGFEALVAGDVDLLVLEAQLLAQPLQLGPRAVAERAPRRVEQLDARDRGRA
jgi:hypothetical protein